MNKFDISNFKLKEKDIYTEKDLTMAPEVLFFKMKNKNWRLLKITTKFKKYINEIIRNWIYDTELKTFCVLQEQFKVLCVVLKALIHFTEKFYVPSSEYIATEACTGAGRFQELKDVAVFVCGEGKILKVLIEE